MLIYLSNRRNAPDISAEPLVLPTAWRIYRSRSGYHYIAAVLGNGSLRLTSPLTAIDDAALQGLTSSGRMYQLSGGPTQDQFVIDLLAAYAATSLGTDFQDVSMEIWAGLSQPLH